MEQNQTASELMQNPSYMERLWNAGQRFLGAGRYVAARRELEAAEAIAWRKRDARSLARLYLPLLETRRQIRQNAAEGLIIIAHHTSPRTENALLAEFFKQKAGTFLLACSDTAHLCRAGAVPLNARHLYTCLESLALIEHTQGLRLCPLADPHFAAGLPVKITTDPKDLIAPDLSPDLVVPLPPPGVYSATHPLHALARESILIAWEALALKWQSRHPVRGSAGRARPEGQFDEKHRAAWEEIAWLRLALHIDPACEPIIMRLMALAEALERS